VADDLRINSDEMACNGGLKYYSMIIILHHLQVGVEQLDQSGVHHTSTSVEISSMLSSGGTMISARSTFRSAMMERSIILAWIAALSSTSL
jgi:hypothetical protein